MEYKTKLIGRTATVNEILENGAIAVSLKYRSNFWKLLERPLINCNVELKLKWTKHCVLATGSVDNVNAKFYVPVTTLLSKDNQKLSKILSKRFKISMYRYCCVKR